MALWISTIGIILDLTRALNLSSNERILFMVSLACWLGLYGYIGYEVGNKKVKHVVLSMALAWYAYFHERSADICFALSRKTEEI